MTRPLLPPRGLFVKTEMLFNLDIPSPVLVTWMRLRALAYGVNETPALSVAQIAKLIGCSVPTVYGHMAALRDKNALRWRSSGDGTIIVSFDDSGLSVNGEILNSKNLESPVNINLIKSSNIDNLQEGHNLTLNESTAQNSEILENSRNLESSTVMTAGKAFCEATGLMVMPANERRAHDIEAIQAMLTRWGYAETVSKLKSAFAAWTARKRKDNGIHYSRLNTAWIDYAMADEMPGGEIAKPAQPNTDGSLYV